MSLKYIPLSPSPLPGEAEREAFQKKESYSCKKDRGVFQARVKRPAGLIHEGSCTAKKRSVNSTPLLTRN